jgi:hypothetical protein
VYSIARGNDHLVLSINTENVDRMVKQIAKSSIDASELVKILTPKNIDIISFVNDLAVKNKVAPKYVISTDIESYHPNDFIYHQCKYNNNICNVILADRYNEVLMSDYTEDCPGTKKLVEYYKNSYNTSQLKVLNKNSMMVRGGGGIYSLIERNIAEFIVYLSWVKINDVLRLVKSKYPESNVDLGSSFEIVERADGAVFDIVRKLKESKDTSFFMLDGKTGNKIKMSIDMSVPEVHSDLTAEYYNEEFLRNMASYRAGTVDAITGAIKSADDRIRKSMSVGIKTGMQLSRSLIKQGWVMEEVSGMECFVYPNKVYINSVVGGKDMKKYMFPEECRDVLYVYDITVPIDATLHGLNDRTLGVKARGFHPHRGSGASNYYGDLDHTTDLNVVCIGDLDGKPIEKMPLLIEALSTAYSPSMMGNAASKCVSSLFGSDYGVMSSDTSSKEVKKLLAYIDPFIKNKGVLNAPTAKKVAATKLTDIEVPTPRIRSGSVFSVT